MDKPSIGQIVHYLLPNGHHRLAVVIHIHSPNQEQHPYQITARIYTSHFDTQHKFLYTTDAYQLVANIPYSHEPKPETWHIAGEC